MKNHPSYDGAGRLRLMRTTLLMLGAIACASCSMNLRTQPESSGQSIAGQWQLQSPSREALAGNLRAVMDQAYARQEERERRRYPLSIPPEEGAANPQASPSSPDAGTSPAGAALPLSRRRNNWEAREQHEKEEALLNGILPGNKLQIIQASNRIEIQADNGGRRRFEAGVTSTLASTYGTFRVESGWQKNVFVVHASDREQGIDIVQRYQRVGSNGLHLQVELNFPNAKDQIFAGDYVLVQP